MKAEHKNLLTKLSQWKQDHILHWIEQNPQEIGPLLASLEKADQTYPGGLDKYIDNARHLLAVAQKGENPYRGYRPYQPDTIDLTRLDETYLAYEEEGLKGIDKVAFVLVAGGLGERLGYSGIKLDIPVEVTVTTTYLNHYAQAIKSLEHRMPSPRPVPFVIMTSGDTHEKTLKTLEDQGYFGLSREQVIILKQELVPAIADNEGRLALDEEGKLIMKPHGHGDIHMLLHTSGTAQRLAQMGIEHLVFIQDTNGQIFNPLLAALGASRKEGFDFNSLAVNRIPGEAVGGLVKLVKEDHEMTVNVEYNQLNGLLRSTISPQGDVPNKEGYSLFPGNINVLIIRLAPYLSILKKSQGIISEFVNPKYADQGRTAFKKPTRLETMMQDLPKLFTKEQKVGVTVFDRIWCFSTNKNNPQEAALRYKKGTPPESAATAESDFYTAGARKLAFGGMTIDTGEEEFFLDIPVSTGPRVILDPDFALTLKEVKAKVKGGSLGKDSTLVLQGKDIQLENVTITEGSALIIRADSGASVKIRDKVVNNKGIQRIPLSEEELEGDSTPEYLKIRGYRMVDLGAEILEFHQPGKYEIS